MLLQSKSKSLKQQSCIHLCVFQVKVIIKINWMDEDEPLKDRQNLQHLLNITPCVLSYVYVVAS